MQTTPATLSVTVKAAEKRRGMHVSFFFWYTNIGTLIHQVIQIYQSFGTDV